jgi:plastocyanin
MVIRKAMAKAGLRTIAGRNDAAAPRRFAITAATISLCLVCVIPVLAGAGADVYLVTQKGQQFNPGFLSIRRGETVRILNDDGELIHHAYVDSKTFSFDSGDQEPGSKTDIVFSVAGNFVVLCGIHPKMRLDVTVK